MINTNKKSLLHCSSTRGGLGRGSTLIYHSKEFAPGCTFLSLRPPGVAANAPSSLRGRKQYSFPSTRYEIPVYFIIIPTQLSSIPKEKGLLLFVSGL